MSSNQLKNSIDSILQAIDAGEKLSLSAFARKLSEATAAYPEDHTIGSMANIVARMAGNNKLFITHAEIRDLYNRLYTNNNKFAELFSDELGLVKKATTPTLYNRKNDDETGSVIKNAYERIVDPILANALNSVFGNKSKPFTTEIAEKACKACGFSDIVKVEAVNGTESSVICLAAFETPKGKTSVFVPIEIIAENALSPSVFIGNNGPEEFTKENLESYISNNAGQKLNISDAMVAVALSNITATEISNVDLAITKLNAAQESESDFSQGQILLQKLEPVAKNIAVNLPTYKNKEAETFASKLESPAGIAEFKFGKNAVNTAKNTIAKYLKSFAMNNSQISVFDVSENAVIFAVAAEGGAFRVPVDMKNMLPTVIIANGTIRDFSQKSIQEFSTNKIKDNKVAIVSSQLYNLKASELIDSVRKYASEENYAGVEDALNVLSEIDEKAYKVAFTEYMNSLSCEKKAETYCSNIVKNSSSNQELCAHTGLPLSKVYQDKNGNCLPKYRKDMSETYEGASFMNAKIFF